MISSELFQNEHIFDNFQLLISEKLDLYHRNYTLVVLQVFIKCFVDKSNIIIKKFL